ncbi:MAG: hypothetical protein JWP75_2753 [Frondihabitans sp.]|nr:hypothetical protein [Frondihabitans sp.]
MHATDPERLRGQSWNGVVVHAGPIGGGDVELIDGLRVTTIERTAVDVALTAPFAAAVATIDATLRRPGVSSPALLAALAASPHARGRVAARRALEFASPRSDSAGESWCRCRLLELGAPSPELQRIFSDSLGDIGAVDFWFAEYGVVIEFDGDIKYLNERYRNGRSASRVVLDERRRERRLLALPEVRTVVRVDWRDLVEPWRLRRLLVEAGVPVR